MAAMNPTTTTGEQRRPGEFGGPGPDQQEKECARPDQAQPARTGGAQWAATGVRQEMYPGGTERRDADIEAGAGRGATEQFADLRATSGAKDEPPA